MRPQKQVVGFLLFLACSGTMAGQDTKEIATYFGAPERVRFAADQAAAESMHSNPQAGEKLRRILSYMTTDEINSKAASVLDRYLTVDDVQSILRFSATPLGKRLNTIFRTQLDPAAFDDAASAFPDDPFLASPAMAHVLKALDSPEWHQTFKDYGVICTCRYLEHEEPTAFNAIRDRCVAIAQGGSVQPPASGNSSGVSGQHPHP